MRHRDSLIPYLGFLSLSNSYWSTSREEGMPGGSLDMPLSLSSSDMLELAQTYKRKRH